MLNLGEQGANQEGDIKILRETVGLHTKRLGRQARQKDTGRHMETEETQGDT